jgi:hypothetical protein
MLIEVIIEFSMKSLMRFGTSSTGLAGLTGKDMGAYHESSHSA